jgi:hypothetical protein
MLMLSALRDTLCYRHDQHCGRDTRHHWCCDHRRHSGPDGLLAAGTVRAVHLLLRDRCRLLRLRRPLSFQRLNLHGQAALHATCAV